MTSIKRAYVNPVHSLSSWFIVLWTDCVTCKNWLVHIEKKKASNINIYSWISSPIFYTIPSKSYWILEYFLSLQILGYTIGFYGSIVLIVNLTLPTNYMTNFDILNFTKNYCIQRINNEFHSECDRSTKDASCSKALCCPPQTLPILSKGVQVWPVSRGCLLLYGTPSVLCVCRVPVLACNRLHMTYNWATWKSK
jgi:hypothetical protein